MEQTNYSNIRNEFYTKYKNDLVPFLKDFDNQRKKKLMLASISLIVFSVIGVFLLIYGLDGLACAMFGIGIITWCGVGKSFENSIKSKIMPSICKLFGNMEWSCNSYTGAEIFKESYVIPLFSGSTFDDIFTGIWQDVKFDIVESEYEIGSGKNRRTVFKGVVVKLGMNKKFTGHTVIKPDCFFHIPPGSGLKRTELEDIEFEKKYDVFTNDEVDARYLITTAFMERLNNLKVAFRADNVSCAFYKKNLYIALATNKDLFSICSLTKPLNDDKQFFAMYEEIVSIIKLIDYFKLNQNIKL